MELEEAKKECIEIKNSFLDKVNSTDPANVYSGNAIETVLQALENSIPKEVIEKKIEEYKEEGFEYENGICTMYYKKESEIDALQELLDRKE